MNPKKLLQAPKVKLLKNCRQQSGQAYEFTSLGQPSWALSVAHIKLDVWRNPLMYLEMAIWCTHLEEKTTKYSAANRKYVADVLNTNTESSEKTYLFIHACD